MMNTSNIKTMKWLVGILVVMNLVLLSVLFFFRPPAYDDKPDTKGFHKDRIHKFLKKSLDLSEEQAVVFKELRSKHFQSIREGKKQIFSLKKEMIDALSSDTPDIIKADSLADQIGKRHTIMEKEMIEHYLNLQAECTPEQRKKLERVFHKAMQRSKGPRKRGGNKRKKE